MKIYSSNLVDLFPALLGISLFLLFPSTITGQQSPVDSLQQEWITTQIDANQLASLLALADNTSTKDLNKALALAEYGIDLSKRLDEATFLAKFLNEKGEILQRLSRYEEAFITFDKAIEQSQLVGENELWAKCVNNKAIVLIDQGDYHGGLRLHLEILQIWEQTDNKNKLGYSCNYIAEDLYFLERYTECAKYAQRAIEYFAAVDNKQGLALAYENLGLSVLETGEQGMALDYINRALAVGEDINMRPEHYGGLVNSKGNILRSMERYEEAIVAFQAAYKVAADLNYEGGMAATMGNIGDVYVLMERYGEALPYREKAVKMKEKNGSFINYSENLLQLSLIYKKVGDYENALLYQEKVLTFRDSTFNKEKEAVSQELTTKYETARKEEQLVQSKKEQRFLYIILGVLFLGGLLLTWTLQQKQRSNKILTQLNEQKAFLIKEVHHRVKNNLQVISSLLQFQSRSINNKSIQSALLDSQSRVESMSLIHKKLYKGDHLAAIEMKSYLSNLADTLVDAYSDEDVIDVVVDMDTFELDVDYAIPLGLIANELVTNSLKHAFPGDRKGVIKIQLNQQDKELILDIVDDGVGKSTSVLKQDGEGGFGSELIGMLTLQLKGKFQQLSEGGLKTQLRFPLQEMSAR